MLRNSSEACCLSRLCLNSMNRLAILSLICWDGLILLYFSKLRPTTLSVFIDTLRPTNLSASSSSLWLSSASFFSSLLGASFYSKWYILLPCLSGEDGCLTGLAHGNFRPLGSRSLAQEMLDCLRERLPPPVCTLNRAASRASLLPFGTYFF